MCNYVHHCRTPVSYDMISAFLGEDLHFETIYRLLKQLAGMITDYKGTLADTPQDHFRSRSNILAEAIVYQANSHSLREMLLRFHNNVSPFRISRFDVFRRRAFDADLFRRAFPQWQDGRDFYDELYNRDYSPFLLQQGALYISRKRQFKEAFQWIDKAITVAPRVFSIRNSHAIILFNANIVQDFTDANVKNTLQQSMEILKDCYNKDRRRTYHALTFSNQSIQYWDAYADKQALDYLKTAVAWLGQERKTSPWNRNVRRLHEILQRKYRNVQ